VTHIVRTLIELGLIEESGNIGSKAGRPSTQLTVRSQAGYIIAVHINRYFMHAMITNLDLKELVLSELYATSSRPSRPKSISTIYLR